MSNKTDLRKLYQFQAQRQFKELTRLSCSIYNSWFRRWNYDDLAFAVSSPGLGDTAFLDQLRSEGQTFHYLSQSLFRMAKIQTAQRKSFLISQK